METLAKLALVVVLIGANAFFVAVEFALVAADRNRFEAEAAAGSRAARVASNVLAKLSFYLSAAQLGVTVTSLLLGFLAAPAVAEALGPAVSSLTGGERRGLSVALALVIATVVQMVAGELVPKSLALARAHRMVLRVAPVVRTYGWLFGPLVRLLSRLANATLRRVGIEPKEELATTRTLDELMVVISAAADEGALDEEARALLERSIRFADKTAADVIVPRHAMVCLRATDTVPSLIEASGRTGFSRFPVVGSGLDDIVGVVRAQRVFELEPSERAGTEVGAIMDEPFVVPESRDLDSLLVEMAGTGRQLAIVVDEYGGTAGLVTVEDALEEIVGAIDDEHDHRRAPEVVRQRRGYLMVGHIHVDDVRDACGLALPEGDYDTLAGFVLHQLGRIPDVGDSVTYQGWRFEVTELDRLRIVRVRVLPPVAADHAPLAHDGEPSAGERSP